MPVLQKSEMEFHTWCQYLLGVLRALSKWIRFGELLPGTPEWSGQAGSLTSLGVNWGTCVKGMLSGGGEL